ncbi:hypothetical protein DDW05_03110 [Candidatus Nanobsidianus stetteri]|uniref:Uncharacterized protein n=1 Tax=Nanobsidianus stetteri TaxID=1294122 RepID=A0A2T9WQC4_NANST|nr:hypothetical protein DDW05_03110 [Candidatus Nanobsidianus stetteri]
MTDTPSYENQSKTLEETLKDTKEEKGNAKTLEDMIKEAERKIVKTKFEYEVYASAIRLAYEQIKKVDPESIPLLGDLIEAMESIPDLDMDLKKYILGVIHEVALDAETSYEYRRKEIIQNLRIGMKFLKNEKGLRKMNELYSRVLAGKILLRNFREYLEEIRDRAPDLDQETQIKYARQKVAYDYLGTIIKGLLRDPTKYEPLYKQFIETDDLGEFVLCLPKYLPKYI